MNDARIPRITKSAMARECNNSGISVVGSLFPT